MTGRAKLWITAIESRAPILEPYHQGQDRKLSTPECLGDHGRAHSARICSRVSMEKARAPPAGNDKPGKKKSQQIENLTHIVSSAQSRCRILRDPKRINLREPFGPSESQMFFFIDLDRLDDRALSQKAFNDKGLILWTLVKILDF